MRLKKKIDIIKAASTASSGYLVTDTDYPLTLINTLKKEPESITVYGDENGVGALCEEISGLSYTMGYVNTSNGQTVSSNVPSKFSTKFLLHKGIYRIDAGAGNGVSIVLYADGNEIRNVPDPYYFEYIAGKEIDSTFQFSTRYKTKTLVFTITEDMYEDIYMRFGKENIYARLCANGTFDAVFPQIREGGADSQAVPTLYKIPIQYSIDNNVIKTVILYSDSQLFDGDTITINSKTHTALRNNADISSLQDWIGQDWGISAQSSEQPLSGYIPQNWTLPKADSVAVTADTEVKPDNMKIQYWSSVNLQIANETPPITLLKTLAKPIESIVISGDGVGDKTINICPGFASSQEGLSALKFPVEADEMYSINFGSRSAYEYVYLYDVNGALIYKLVDYAYMSYDRMVVKPHQDGYMAVGIVGGTSKGIVAKGLKYTLNTTQTNNLNNNQITQSVSSGKLDYEPYGVYKIPLILRGNNLANFPDIVLPYFPYNINPSDISRVFKKLGTFTFSTYIDNTEGTDSAYVRISLYINGSWSYLFTNHIRAGNNGWAYITFTIDNSCSGNYNFQFAGTASKTSFSKTMLEYGNTRTEFEPYFTPVTNKIYLDEPLMNNSIIVNPKAEAATHGSTDISAIQDWSQDWTLPKADNVIITADTEVEPDNMKIQYQGKRR